MKLLRRSCFCLWLKVRQFFFFFSFDIKLTFLVKSNPLKSSRHPADPIPSSHFCPVAVFIPQAMQAEHVFLPVTLLLRNYASWRAHMLLKTTAHPIWIRRPTSAKALFRSLSFSAVLFYIPSPFLCRGLTSSHRLLARVWMLYLSA